MSNDWVRSWRGGIAHLWNALCKPGQAFWEQHRTIKLMKNSPKVFLVTVAVSSCFKASWTCSNHCLRGSGSLALGWICLECAERETASVITLFINKKLPNVLEEVWLKSYQIPLCLVVLSSDKDFCVVSGFLWDMKLLRRVFLNTVILDFNKTLVMLQMKNLIQFWTLQSYMWKATAKACRKTVVATWKARFSH